MVRDTVCAWLRTHNVAHDVAVEHALGEGVDWFRVPPSAYTHLLFACGPVGASLAVAELIERFASCRRLAINVSLVGDSGWRPFDVMLERDGAGQARPDLALDQPQASIPTVAIVQAHRQSEHVGARPEIAHAAFDRLLDARAAAPFHIDTVLDRSVPGRRSAGEIQALFGRADVVLTTRLHGLVLALAAGVPAVAVDPIVGGAKLLAQARALDWPASTTVDRLDDESLHRDFDWCLTPAARERAATARALGAEGSARLERMLFEGLRRP